MKSRLRLGVVLFCLMVGVPMAQAHHAGGGAGKLSLQQAISERLNPPRTNVFFNFAFDGLDDSLGEVLLFQLQGEYAVTPRFAIGGRVPFWVVRQEFLPDSNRLGDVALLFKGQVVRSLDQRLSLLLGLDISFPTGSDTVSLGAGAVAFLPYLSFSKDFEVVQLFTTLSSSYEVADTVNPTIGYELGLVFPLIKEGRGRIPLELLVAFQGALYVVSDTFESGSTKGFVVAGMLLQLTENWEAAFLGRVSVLDTLNFREDVSFTDFTTGLLNDVKAGFIFNLGYAF